MRSILFQTYIPQRFNILDINYCDVKALINRSAYFVTICIIGKDFI